MPADRGGSYEYHCRESLPARAFLLLLLAAVAFPTSTSAQVWSLDPDPVLSIGGLTEDPDYILSNVVGGLRLPDGRVVLADRFTNGLRAYSSEGVFLQDVGGEGEGPGEYEHIRGMDRCAGSPAVAFDLHWDMKIYDAELRLVEERSSLLPGIGNTPYQFACGPSGHWVATGWGQVGEQTQPGYFIATAPVVLGYADSVLADFGQRLSSERIGTVRDDGSIAGSGPHPFGRQTTVAIGSERVYLGEAAEYRIEVFDLRGSPLPPLEWNGPGREVTPDHIETYRDGLMEGISPGRAPAFRRWLRDLPEVEEFPAYDQFRVDQEENLWVRYFQRPGEASIQWVVFSDTGHKIGEISLPDRASLLDSGPDFVLLVELDELDVATVHLYRLVRS